MWNYSKSLSLNINTIFILQLQKICEQKTNEKQPLTNKSYISHI